MPRHNKYECNYLLFLEANSKNFKILAMADGGTGLVNGKGESGGNERGEGRGSVSWLTTGRDSPWWPDLAGEGGGGGLFWFCSVGSGGPSTGWQRGAARQMQLGEGRLRLVDACLCGLRSR